MTNLRSVILAGACAIAAAGCGNDRPAGDRAATPLAGVADGEGFRAVVEEVIPSIVFIQTEGAVPQGLERLLPPGHPTPEGSVPLGMGSGVLYRDDGYILTNNHVVQDAQRVRVVLHDRRFFDGEVVGRDPSTDVAVVRVMGNGFPTAQLGDSDAVGLGDWVLAMGSPLGLQFSVTAGIVSGVGRAIGILGTQRSAMEEEAAPLEHFIQTDAALSPGNSGGPLLNTAGEVIGINTAVAAPRGTPGSFGFAIPSNLARRIADQLVEFGEVRRPYMGVGLANLTPAAAEAQGLQTLAGAAVMRVEPGSPADRAGIRAGDVIRAVGNVTVLTVSDLQNALARMEPGATTRTQIVRAGQELALRVELGVVRSGVGPQAAAAPRR